MSAVSSGMTPLIRAISLTPTPEDERTCFTPPPKTSTPPLPSTPSNGNTRKSPFRTSTPVRTQIDYLCKDCETTHTLIYSSSDGSVRKYTVESTDACYKAYNAGEAVFKKIRTEAISK